MISLSNADLKARKQHVCDLCNRIIEKGEEYNRQGNVYDGHLYTFKTCAHCQVATARAITLDGSGYWEEGYDSFYVFDMLREQPETLADLRMAVLFARGWRRKTDGTLYPIPEKQAVPA